MECRDILTILAILFSPIIAVVISLWIQWRREKLQQKRIIFSTLMATRPQSYSDEIVRALNMIDVAFHDNDSVRRIWGEYIDMLNKPICDEQLNEKRAELLQEMAKGVKLGKEISHLDLKKCYMPVGLVEERQRSKEIGVELLHVLKESHGIKLIQKEQSEKEGTQ